MGFNTDGVDPATYADLRSVFHAYLRPGDWAFDFSNAPGLYYYLLQLNPRTRYYDVSMAIGNRALFPAVNTHAAGPVIAPGFSCRHQIADGTGHKALHPLSLVRRHLGS